MPNPDLKTSSGQIISGQDPNYASYVKAGAKPVSTISTNPTPAVPTATPDLTAVSKGLASGAITNQQQAATQMAKTEPAAQPTMTNVSSQLSSKANQPQTAYAGVKDTELNAAYTRSQQGTATQTDLNNLKYAQSKGWNPTTTAPTAEKAATGVTEAPKATSEDYMSKLTASLNKGLFNAADIAADTGMTIDEVNNQLQSNYNLSYLANENKINTQLDSSYQDYKKKMDDLDNGIFELTADEQAQIQSVKDTFDKLREDQLMANRNYEGTVSTGELRSGRQEFMNQISSGIYKQAVDSGLAKIKDLEVQAASKVSELKQLFKDKKYKQVEKAYSDLSTYLDKKKAAITDIHNATKQLYDDIDKAKQQEIDNSIKYETLNMKAFENQLNSDKFDYQQKQDMIQNLLANEKQTWQEKQDLIKNQLEQNKLKLDATKFNADQIKAAKDYDLQLKKYALDVKKAQTADNPTSYNEWMLAGGASGTGKSYAEFLTSKAADKQPTADQSKNAGYAMRVKASNDIINNMTKQFTDKSYISQESQKWLPNVLKTPQQQQLEQAEVDFVNAVLRPESGAVIGPSEFTNAEKQYFPQPGDSPEVLKQRANNRMIKLKGLVQASGSALSEDFKNNLNKASYPDLQSYIDINPDKSDYVKQIRTTYPDWSPDDVLQFIQSQSFNTVGGDTNTAVMQKLANVSPGEKGGQCGRFVNKITGLGVGDSYKSKMSKMDPSITTPEPGMVFTMPYKDTGHIGFIQDVDLDKGTAKVIDSNYGLDEKIKVHTIPLKKMTGFARVA